jgi:hypothetical protein
MGRRLLSSGFGVCFLFVLIDVDIRYGVQKLLSCLGIARELRPFRIPTSTALEGVECA